MRKAIGLPKKLRNKSNNKPKNPHVLEKKLATVTCHRCGAMGHNKQSYKGKSVADRVIPKGGNKNKKSKNNPTRKIARNTNKKSMKSP